MKLQIILMFKFIQAQLKSKNIIDIIYSIFPQIIGLLTSIVTSVLIAKNLGPNDLGVYTLLLGLISIAGTLIDLGITQTTIRYASICHQSNLLKQQAYIIRWSFNFRLVLLVFFSVLFYFFLNLVGTNTFLEFRNENLFWYVIFITLINLLLNTPNLYLQSSKQFKKYAILGVVSKVLLFFYILMLYLFNIWSIKLLLGSLIFSGLVSFFISLKYVTSEIYGNFQSEANPFLLLIKDLKNLFKVDDLYNNGLNTKEESASSFLKYYFLITVLSIFINQVDIWAIKYYFSNEEVGFYSIGQRYSLPVNLLFTSIIGVMWPHMTIYRTKNEILIFLKRNKNKFLILAFCILLYSISVPFTTPFLFGSKYLSAIPIGIFLSLKGLISVFTGLFTILLYNLNNTKSALFYNFLQALSLFFFIFLLGKSMGAISISLSVLFSELVLFILVFINLFKKLK